MISAIVARGFGSFGGVELVPTRGFAIADLPTGQAGGDEPTLLLLLRRPWA